MYITFPTDTDFQWGGTGLELEQQRRADQAAADAKARKKAKRDRRKERKAQEHNSAVLNVTDPSKFHHQRFLFYLTRLIDIERASDEQQKDPNDAPSKAKSAKAQQAAKKSSGRKQPSVKGRSLPLIV